MKHSIILTAELPMIVGLEVDFAHLAARPRKRQQCRGIEVDRANGKSAITQKARQMLM
jgi:hypothetical protein